MRALYLLRHGPTSAALSGAPLGMLDLPVNPEGEARWPLVRSQLSTLPLGRVLCSPLRRTRLHAHTLGLPCQVREGLREQAFGDWEGWPWTSLDATVTEAFFADPVRNAPPGGESFADCADRVLADLGPELGPEGPPTLVLGHAGPLRAILARCVGLPLERVLDFAWDPYGLSLLELWEPGRGRLRFHNRVLG